MLKFGRGLMIESIEWDINIHNLFKLFFCRESLDLSFRIRNAKKQKRHRADAFMLLAVVKVTVSDWYRVFPILTNPCLIATRGISDNEQSTYELDIGRITKFTLKITEGFFGTFLRKLNQLELAKPCVFLKTKTMFGDQ